MALGLCSSSCWLVISAFYFWNRSSFSLDEILCTFCWLIYLDSPYKMANAQTTKTDSWFFHNLLMVLKGWLMLWNLHSRSNYDTYRWFTWAFWLMEFTWIIFEIAGPNFRGGKSLPITCIFSFICIRSSWNSRLHWSNRLSEVSVTFLKSQHVAISSSWRKFSPFRFELFKRNVAHLMDHENATCTLFSHNRDAKSIFQNHPQICTKSLHFNLTLHETTKNSLSRARFEPASSGI